jgi:hypothetical protein
MGEWLMLLWWAVNFAVALGAFTFIAAAAARAG